MKSFRTILRNKTAVGAAQQQQYNLHLKAHAEEVLLNSSNKSEEVAWFLGLAAASAAESRPQAINPLTHTTKHTQPQPHTTRHITNHTKDTTSAVCVQPQPPTEQNERATWPQRTGAIQVYSFFLTCMIYISSQRPCCTHSSRSKKVFI